MDKVELLSVEALKLLGFPSVRYSGSSKGQTVEGFDCSGFVRFCLQKCNFPIEENIRHCNEFFDHFGVLIHAKYVKRGDLIFFSRDGRVPRHIGIMLSPDTYIHAPGRNNTKVEIATVITEDIISSFPNQIYAFNPIGFKRLAMTVGRYQKVM